MKTLSLIRNMAAAANYYLFLLLLITLPFPWRISHTVWLVWMLFYLLEARFIGPRNSGLISQNSGYNKPWLPFVMIAGYIILEVVSVSWSADTHSAWSLIERHLTLPFLILVAFFGVNERYKSVTLLKTLSASSVISVFVYLLVIYCVQNYHSILFYPTDPYHPFELPVRDGFTSNIKHRLFYCIVLICSLCSLPYLWRNGTLPRRQRTAMTILVALVLLAGIYLTFSRVAIIILAVVAVAMAVTNVRNRKQAIIATVVLVLLTGALVAAVLTNPRTQEWRLDPRVEIWKTAYKHSDEVPIYGLGAGQLHNFMTEKYHEEGLELQETFRFMPHNQYLSTYMETGILGLVLLVTILLVFCRSFHNDTRRMALLWSLVYAVSMFTDDTLERIDPLITFIALSVVLICMENESLRQSY